MIPSPRKMRADGPEAFTLVVCCSSSSGPEQGWHEHEVATRILCCQLRPLSHFSGTTSSLEDSAWQQSQRLLGVAESADFWFSWTSLNEIKRFFYYRVRDKFQTGKDRHIRSDRGWVPDWRNVRKVSNGERCNRSSLATASAPVDSSLPSKFKTLFQSQRWHCSYLWSDRFCKWRSIHPADVPVDQLGKLKRSNIVVRCGTRKPILWFLHRRR